MGTPKRERQKANRQLRLEEMARQARSQKRRRIGLRYFVGVPAIVLVVAGLFWFANRDTGSGVATVDTSLPGASTTIDPFASTTLPGTTLPAATTLPPPSTVPGATITGDTPCPAADGSSPRTITFAKEPPMCIDPAKTYTATITTNKGDLTVEFDAKAAPLTVNNFVVLARYHYFDNTVCHRILENFVAQCGDPTATGSGGPGYSFKDELPTGYAIGDLAMANSGANTNGSQFFIITGEQGAALPPSYSKFGKVTAGMDTTVAAIAAAASAGDPAPPKDQVVIQSVSVTEA